MELTREEILDIADENECYLQLHNGVCKYPDNLLKFVKAVIAKHEEKKGDALCVLYIAEFLN